jgi:hypothetical protein
MAAAIILRARVVKAFRVFASVLSLSQLRAASERGQ